MKSKLLLTLILGIMLISFCSALMPTEKYEKINEGDKYDKFVVKDWFGLGSELVTAELYDYKEECIGGTDCNAVIKIDGKKDVSVKGIQFYTWDILGSPTRKKIHYNKPIEYSITRDKKDIIINAVKPAEDYVDWVITLTDGENEWTISNWAWWNGNYWGNYGLISSYLTTSYGANDPTGIILLNNYLYLIDRATDKVYQLYNNGTSTGFNFTIADSGATEANAITTNNTNFFIYDETDEQVYIYLINGTYTGQNWDTNAVGLTVKSICFNGTHILATDSGTDTIYYYTITGTYTGQNFSIAAQSGASNGLTCNDGNIWVNDENDNLIYKYYSNRSYSGFSFNNYASDEGITKDSDYFFIVDNGIDTINKIAINEFNYTISLLNPINNTKIITNNYSFSSNSKINAGSVLNSTLYLWNKSSYDMYWNTTGLVAWYQFDDNTANDYFGVNNGTNTNGAYQSTKGKIGGSAVFDGVNDYINTSSSASLGNFTDNSFTISMWINSKPYSARTRPFEHASQVYKSYLWSGGGATFVCYVRNTTNVDSGDSAPYPLSYNESWHFVTCKYNSTSVEAFVDGVSNGATAVQGTILQTTNRLFIGKSYTTAEYFNGSIDDVRIYNRTLSATEIANLYAIEKIQYYNNVSATNTSSVVEDKAGTNDGTLVNGATTGTAYARYGLGGANFDGVNDYVNLSQISFINYTNPITLSLWMKTDKISQSQMLFHHSTSTSNRFGVTIESSRIRAGFYSGTYYGATSSNSNIADSNYHFVTYVYNGTAGSLYYDGSLQSGTNGPSIGASGYAIGFGNTLYSNGSIDDVRIYNRTLTAQEISDLYTNTNPSTSGLVAFYNFDQFSEANFTYDATGLTDGDKKWNVWAEDESMVYGAWATNENTLLVDTTLPTISITSPSGNLGIKTIPYDVSLNYSATDTNLDSCWFNTLYNSTNRSLASCANATVTIYDNSPTNTIYVWANDTYGNMNYSSISYELLVLSSNTFNATGNELKSETFSVNITTPNEGLVSYTNLNYDGVDYPAVSSNAIRTYTRTLDSTNIGNNTFYWTINYNGVDYSSTNYYQNVLTTILTLCNSTINRTFMNITFKDEVSGNNINGSISTSTFTYYISDSSVYKTYTYLNVSENRNYALCVQQPYLTINVNNSITAYSTGYPLRTFEFDNTLTNVTTNTTLYLLSSAEGIYQTVIVITGLGDVVENAVIKAYNNLGSIVDTRVTDSNGQAQLWLNPNSGHTLVTTASGYDPNIKSINPSSTTVYVTLGAEGGVDLPYLQFNGTGYSLTYSNITGNITFTFNNSEASKGCLAVNQENANGTIWLYSTCVINTTGAVVYHVPGNGTYYAFGSVVLNQNYSEVAKVVQTLVVTIGKAARFEVIGTFGRVISIVAIGTGAMIGVAAGSVILGSFLVVALSIAMFKMGFLYVPESFLYSVVGIIILLALVGFRRRNG